MKIQCDVCNKDEATMFCVADEAALCEACDHRVHHANKLASKHQRFSLLQPSSKEGPLCDICQEKRAFLFCQQDRAILCRDCDVSIHKANQHTQKHNRFLLTGVKLSATSALYSSSSSSSPSPCSTASPASSATSQSVNGSYTVPTFKPQNSVKKSALSVSTTPSAAVKTPTTHIAATAAQGQPLNGSQLMCGSTTSSISEYLIETLPGWHVEDFLDLSSSTNGFCKTINNEMQGQPFWDADLAKSLHSSSSAESTSLFVPQLPTAAPVSLSNSGNNNTLIQTYPSLGMAFGAQIGFKEPKDITNSKSSRKWNDDNFFAVPQICPPSTALKRSRTLW